MGRYLKANSLSLDRDHVILKILNNVYTSDCILSSVGFGVILGSSPSYRHIKGGGLFFPL